MVLNREILPLVVSLLLGSSVRAVESVKHPIVKGAANFVSLEVRSSVDYYGPLFIGSQYEEERVIYDTASANVMVGNLQT